MAPGDADTDSDEAPLDAASERLRARLARLLLISGAFMMLGFIAVFATLVYKMGFASGGSAAAEPVEAAIRLPPGAQLIAADLDGDRALLTIRAGAGGSTLLLVDLRSGRVTGRFPLQAD